jgi:predicted dehydrogenase
MDANVKGTGFLLVGAGGLGSQRAAAVAATGKGRLVGVIDRDPEAASRVESRYGAIVAKDLDAGLDLPGVDAVLVCTPHADHAAQVGRALEAGKHVLCEKPLAIDGAEARALAVRADERGVRLATGLNHRFYPPVRDALAIVREWAIGRVESVRAQIGHRASAGFLASWHTEVERSGGGTLLDNGPHACDLIRLFMGEVVAAQGYVRNALDLPRGCESDAFALFRNHDRAVAELRSSWALEEGYLTIEVRGSEGHLRVETAPWRFSCVLADGRKIRRRYVDSRGLEVLHRKRHGCESSLVLELDAFLDHTQPHPRPGASGWDGCRATEMVQAVYRSAESGREIALDPPQVRLPQARRRTLAGGHP